MIRTLFSAATGMQAQQLNMDTISNNLANVNTTGFKKGRPDFQDLIYQTLQLAGMASSATTEVPTGMQVGLGVRPAAIQRLFIQGDFVKTDNSLDLAVEGQGFFQVQHPNGDTLYSRSGAFKLDSDGRVVNSDGWLLLPEITIPADAEQINVASDGTVSVRQAGNTAAVQVGNIELVTFSNPTGLDGAGRNNFRATDASGDPIAGTPGEDGLGEIQQGYLELSNVSVVDEMVAMIVAQRAYEANSKSIQAGDQILQMANNLRR